MKLNLGCGWDHRPGWVNIDFLPEHKPDILADVLQLPFEDGAADYALAQDVLEHLPRTSTNYALKEWSRVLSNDGTLELRVPSLFHAVELMKSQPTISFHETLIQNLYGTQAYTGDVHLTSFTDLTLTHYLHQNGFTAVSIEMKDDWMFDIRAQKNRALPRVAVIMSKGIYGEEESQFEKWRWIAQNENLRIINNDDSVKNVLLKFKPIHLHDKKAKIIIWHGSQKYTPLLDKEFSLAVEAQPGLNELNFEVSALRINEESNRNLRLQLKNFDVKVTN
jgi:predicted SAM-dependent methyltransferase